MRRPRLPDDDATALVWALIIVGAFFTGLGLEVVIDVWLTGG